MRPDRQPRSPKYPFISLRKAVARARELASARGGPWTHADVAQIWGIGSESSALPQTIGALKQYDLLTVVGDDRRLQLTGAAHYLLEEGQRDPTALQHAARSPSVFRELWDQLEKPEADRAQLLQSLTSTERISPFGARAAEEVLRIFLETAEFAGLKVAPCGKPLETILREGDSAVPSSWDFEEPLPGGKIRLLFRNRPNRSDFELLRAYCTWRLDNPD